MYLLFCTYHVEGMRRTKLKIKEEFFYNLMESKLLWLIASITKRLGEPVWLPVTLSGCL